MNNRKWMRVTFQRAVLVVALLLIQAGVIALTVWKGSRYSAYIDMILTVISFAVVVYVVNRRGNPTMKLVWVIILLLFPIFGGLFYLLLNFQSSTRELRKGLDAIGEETRGQLVQDPDTMERLRRMYPDCGVQAGYLAGAGFPLYGGTTCEYLTPGEKKLERLLEELRKATRFIFIEYFIIAKGKMWSDVLNVLREKVAVGVEVRVIYDDMGSLLTLPVGYDKYLESIGIQCVVFNPFRPVLSAIQNNRDHRKIVVIDGHTAFTGGINLADEYINVVERHGHWKDASIMLKGEATWGFTMMFLQMWDLHKGLEGDFGQYRPHCCHSEMFASDGFAQPYADSPLDSERVGENVYLNLIANARQYLYINTPYLILDYELLTALTLAAKSGVDVRIVTPHRWDKWLVHMATRSFYAELIEAGVKIYEYTNGFIHSKTFVSDDRTATVGTINLDYRSLYLHFECGVWIQGGGAVAQVRDDFLTTLEKCQSITLADCRENYPTRLIQKLLQLLAPLM